MPTKRQKQILDFITSFQKKKGFAPSLEEIKKHLKLSSVSTIHFHIKKLQDEGFLNKGENSPRSISVYESQQMVKIPLMGTIAAGQPIEAIQVKETIAIPKTKVMKGGNFYALRVAGNSMIDENINDGDVVLVKEQQSAENGQKVVALIDNYEATLKTFYKEKNQIRLQPANKEYEPIIIKKGEQEVVIQGLVVDVIRNIDSIVDGKTAFGEDLKKEKYKISEFDDAFVNIKEILGKPYYETEDCMIFNLDCISAMEKIPKQFIDLTVTSPPYNIGKEYEENMSVVEYIRWCTKWMNEIFRLTSKAGSFWLNIGYFEFKNKAKALPIAYLLWDKSPFYLIQEVIWNYGAGVAGKNFLSPRNEKLLWYVKNSEDYIFNLDDIRDKNVKYPNQKKNGKLRCNPLGKNPSDVWQIPKVTSGKNRSSKERMNHPAQFPEALIDRVIKASSNKKQIIFDPFLGSGTSAIVSLENKRKFIGIEISKEYCDISKKRIQDYLRKREQLKLFK